MYTISKERLPAHCHKDRCDMFFFSCMSYWYTF